MSASNDFIRSMLLDVLRAQVVDDVLFEKMIPHFPPFAKRALRDDGRWAASLSRSDVDLVTTPIAEITPHGVRTADGEEHPADVVIYGTGFRASEFVAPMKVYGVGGVELSEEWDGDAQAYLGMTVPGFPNFFLLYGPNTNLVINGSILIMVECQVRYTVDAIGRLLRGGHRTMSCRRDVHERYGRDMEEGNARMVWGVADVPTWYRNAQRARDAELALRPAHVLGPHPGARPGGLRVGLRFGCPSPSRELTEILALVPRDFADPDADYRAVRAMMAPFHGHPVPAHVSVTEVELGGVRCAWYEDTRRPRPATVSSSIATAAASCRPRSTTITSTGRCWPSSSRPASSWRTTGSPPSTSSLPRTGTAPPPTAGSCRAASIPTRVVVSGDSCGGLLGLGALLDARDGGLPPPACFLSISGWFDVSVPDPVESGGQCRDPFLTAAWVRNRGREYAAGRVALDDPRLSPVYADLAGLPPLYLPAGQYDTLRKGTEALARAAMDAGVAVTAESWPGMVHGWQGLVTAGVPEAVAAFARARAYLDDLGA